MSETTRKSRADVGLCPECGEPTEFRGSRCPDCSEKTKKLYREQVTEARICHKCRKEPALEWLKCCVYCGFDGDYVDYFVVRDGGGEREDPQWQPWWRKKGQKGWRSLEKVRRFAAEEKKTLEDGPKVP